MVTLVIFVPTGFDSPAPHSKQPVSRSEETRQVTDAASSPHAEVRPKYTPEEQKHRFFNMRNDQVESLLYRVRRPKNDDIDHATRPKTIAVLKRKLINQLRIPTRSNPSFHLYREVDLMTPNAAKAIFWDLKRSGPHLRGKSLYYNWETDDPKVIKQWFSLQDRRKNGIGQAMMRSHGQVLVMARPPFLAEHQSNEEAEGLKVTCGVMTLNCRGVPRFAPPPDPEEDSPNAAEERKKRADEDTAWAWELVKELAERGSCDLDRHWYYALSERFGATWLSYLTEAIDSSPSESELPEHQNSASETEQQS